jgi:L-ascorbate metabolism protein UlaG (beta-lactamase superfamily)
MNIKFLGHSSLLIEGNGIKALVDPFLKNNPQYIEDKNDIENITHIFITHAHGDHIGDAIEIAKANDSMIIANAEICNILYFLHNDLNYHPMHIGGTFNFDFGRVKMTPALHGSGYTDKDNKIQDGGNPAGFVIEVDTKKVYHAGDTGLTYDMKLLERERIDVAFLPIGGNYTMDIDDAVEAARFIGAKITVPMHYNTFGMIKANPIEFHDKLLGHKVIILKPSEAIEI